MLPVQAMTTRSLSYPITTFGIYDSESQKSVPDVPDSVCHVPCPFISPHPSLVPLIEVYAGTDTFAS